MLQAVKPHLFKMLRLLDERGLTNHVLVISRWHVKPHVKPEDCAVLNSFQNIKVTLLITHSGIDDERVEPVRHVVPDPSSVGPRAAGLTEPGTWLKVCGSPGQVRPGLRKFSCEFEGTKNPNT